MFNGQRHVLDAGSQAFHVFGHADDLAGQLAEHLHRCCLGRRSGRHNRVLLRGVGHLGLLGLLLLLDSNSLVVVAAGLLDQAGVKQGG
ncbi:hypothetical protein D9M69_695170 [compost metagenome]